MCQLEFSSELQISLFESHTFCDLNNEDNRNIIILFFIKEN